MSKWRAISNNHHRVFFFLCSYAIVNMDYESNYYVIRGLDCFILSLRNEIRNWYLFFVLILIITILFSRYLMYTKLCLLVLPLPVVLRKCRFHIILTCIINLWWFLGNVNNKYWYDTSYLYDIHKSDYFKIPRRKNIALK